ncbi:MAG: VPLPA-CTERM sorting domain-containing protein [Tateyamaria sp.]|uniref:VPLPA-CTERM sorting domain-containing protein n=1 Tax=Tateyamaria sp. TaxID=1929288 RepID=UPI00329CACDA
MGCVCPDLWSGSKLCFCQHGNWGAEGGANNFVTDEIAFAGFDADTLFSVSGNANFGTNNGSLFPVTFDLEIRLDGVWTSIFNQATTGTTYLSNAIANVGFVYGTVDGLRGTATGQQPGHVPASNWAIGDLYSPTLFNFQALNPPSTVPLPAGLPLLLAGMFGLGLLRRRLP